MKLIVGLGNIGQQYEKTRHNAGFMAVDNFIFTHQLGVFESKPKYSASILEANFENERVMFAKPTTLMNRSGQALIDIKRYFSVSSATTLIVHDDIDLNFGKIRVRQGAGSGGHNGVNSLPGVVQEKSWRIRIGVSNQHRLKKAATDFVLERFMPEEFGALPEIFIETDRLLEQFISDKSAEKTLNVR
ncbi:MAG: aminoacyl-tRNA hydrolase [Candidatus Saccharimonadales bacterium]|nr:aminoacyl-tRNA hydrolase [Candidatus Saccharimonadales bacterium]